MIMEKGDIVKFKPTSEVGVVVWHDENKKAIDVSYKNVTRLEIKRS